MPPCSAHFRGFLAVDLQALRQAGGGAQLQVQPHKAVIVIFGPGLAPAEGPLHITGEFEKRAIHKAHLLEQFAQCGIGLLELGNLRLKRGNQRLQQRRIDDALQVAEGALADTLHLELILHQRALAEVLDHAQAAHHGIKERQQQRGEGVVITQDAIGMGVSLAQLFTKLQKRSQLLLAGNSRQGRSLVAFKSAAFFSMF